MNSQPGLRVSQQKLAWLALPLALLVLPAATVSALDLYRWNDHAAPFPYRFGNGLDTHQQTRMLANAELVGFLYVHFTGTTTQDGLRVATHGDCNEVRCTVGWTIAGKPREAAFLHHPMHDHPVFFLDRSQIPQPGSYTHFHRTGEDEHSSGAGYVLALLAVDRFCFIHHGAEEALASASCEDNGGVAVSPGPDVATHSNLATSVPPMEH